MALITGRKNVTPPCEGSRRFAAPRAARPPAYRATATFAGALKKKRKEKHVKLFICKIGRRRKTSAGMIHSSRRLLIGREAAPAAAGDDYFAR